MESHLTYATAERPVPPARYRCCVPLSPTARSPSVINRVIFTWLAIGRESHLRESLNLLGTRNHRTYVSRAASPSAENPRYAVTRASERAYNCSSLLELTRRARDYVIATIRHDSPYLVRLLARIRAEFVRELRCNLGSIVRSHYARMPRMGSDPQMRPEGTKGQGDSRGWTWRFESFKREGAGV